MNTHLLVGIPGDGGGEFIPALRNTPHGLLAIHMCYVHGQISIDRIHRPCQATTTEQLGLSNRAIYWTQKQKIPRKPRVTRLRVANDS